MQQSPRRSEVLDDCGGVHVAFNWTAIKGTADTKRIVAGRSGAGRAKPADKLGIVLPGPEFVGSTPHKNPQGDAPGVDWRKPDIRVWELPGHGEELKLVGTVDENDSIVHFYPRIPVNRLCEGSTLEACFGLDRIADGTVPDTCACKDDHGDDCTCKDDANEMLFACTGSPRLAGKPCTRAAHCKDPQTGEQGTCGARPFCYEPGAVRGENPSPHPGHTCFTDANCTDGTKTQCGFLLFNFTKNRTPPLDSDIARAPKDERGACESNNAPACSKGGSGKPPKCQSGACRGYVLEAQGKR